MISEPVANYANDYDGFGNDMNDIMDDGNMSSQFLSTSYADRIEVPVFVFQGHTVWGATAMMLNEIRELLKEVL